MVNSPIEEKRKERARRTVSAVIQVLCVIPLANFWYCMLTSKGPTQPILGVFLPPVAGFLWVVTLLIAHLVAFSPVPGTRDASVAGLLKVVCVGQITRSLVAERGEEGLVSLNLLMFFAGLVIAVLWLGLVWVHVDSHRQLGGSSEGA